VLQTRDKVQDNCGVTCFNYFWYIVKIIGSRRVRLAGHATRMEQMRNIYCVLVGKLEGKRPRGRSRRIWEDNIRMDLTEIVWEGVDWFHLAQDGYHWRAVVNTVMKNQVENFLTS
jgi:hypothetical protein